MGTENSKVDLDTYTLDKFSLDFKESDFPETMAYDVFIKKINSLFSLLDTDKELKRSLVKHSPNSQSEFGTSLDPQAMFYTKTLEIISLLIFYPLKLENHKIYLTIIEMYKYLLINPYFYSLFMSKSFDAVLTLMFKVKNNIGLIKELCKCDILNLYIIINNVQY